MAVIITCDLCGNEDAHEAHGLVATMFPVAADVCEECEQTVEAAYAAATDAYDSELIQRSYRILKETGYLDYIEGTIGPSEGQEMPQKADP